MSAKMRWLLCLVLLTAALVPTLSAEIIEVRQYHGKQVLCVHGGLIGVAKSCGTEGYSRVFTGTVKSAIEIGDDDKSLQLIPDEVFLGDSTNEVTATTDQACLPTEIQAGDRWLFYLYRDEKSGELILGFDGPSKPIADADVDISMLRDLVRLTDSGILIGTIKLLSETKGVELAPLSNRKVVAKSVTKATEYATFTNKTGHFKFELPPGSYDVSAAPEYGFREVESFGSMLRGSVPVEKQQCWERNFTVKQTAKSKHAKLPPGSTP